MRTHTLPVLRRVLRGGLGLGIVLGLSWGWAARAGTVSGSFAVRFPAELPFENGKPDLDSVPILAGGNVGGVSATNNLGSTNLVLKSSLFGHNVELEYRVLKPGLLGYTDGRRITCGTGQPTPVEFATLTHETAHLLLHFPTDGSPRPELVTRETEAEAPSVSERNFRKASSLISPEAMANSRWRPFALA